MSWGSICFAISAFIFILLGIDFIQDTGKVHLILIAAGLVPLGLLLNPFPLPVFVGRRPAA